MLNKQLLLVTEIQNLNRTETHILNSWNYSASIFYSTSDSSFKKYKKYHCKSAIKSILF